MSLLTVLLLVSIAIRATALLWSATLVMRLRDWKMGTLTAMLALMTARQILTLFTHLDLDTASLAHEFVDEIPGLLVSILALLFVLVLSRVITSQRRETEALVETEGRLKARELQIRLMLEQMPAVVWTTDSDLRFTSSVGAGLVGLGLEPGQVAGKSLYDFFQTEDDQFPAIRAHLDALTGDSVPFEQNWGGQTYHAIVEPLRDAGGAIHGTLGVALDITEMVASEMALRKSEERYRNFLTQTAEGIWRLELVEPLSTDATEEEQIDLLYRNGSLAECSDAFARMYGLASASVLVGARLDEILPRADPRNRGHLRAFLRRGYSLADAESSDVDEQNRQRFFVDTLTGIVAAGKLLRIWGIRRDITAQKQAERALRSSEEKYRELFVASQDAIFISTPEGQLIDINPAGQKLLGYESKEDLLRVDIGTDLYVDPDERAGILELLEAQGACRDVEIQLRRADGSILTALETTSTVKDPAGRVIAFRGMLRDVTQQRLLEEQLLRSQRMEAIGRLAGGVAHDFNNLLTVINGRSDLLRTLLDPDSPLVREVDEIKQAGKRAAALTRQLLILSRRQVGSSEVVNLNRVIENVENLLRRSIGERIELVVTLEAALDNVRADPSQIEQVLLNLALNARDAMPRGGRLMIETAGFSATAESMPSGLTLAPGRYVVLRVEDTGTGIDPAIRSQIFEPFVSSKPAAEGTGLGLATVYGIVQQGGGQIRVESEPGRGAGFEIYLPAVQEPEEIPPEPKSALDVPRGNERILLVEDEESVRSLLRRFLDAQGYRVIEAADGKTAFEEVEKRNGDFDLVLTDLVMPGMGGFELARRIGSRWPEMKILYMSGYSEEAVGLQHRDPSIQSDRFLQKPFSTELLARSIRSVLEAQG